MSEIDNTRCEFTKEVLSASVQARNKAAADWNAPLAVVYGQVALELRRVLDRHAKNCLICLEEDRQDIPSHSLIQFVRPQPVEVRR